MRKLSVFPRFVLLALVVSAVQVAPAQAEHPLEWDIVPQTALLTRVNDAASGLRVLWWNIGKGVSSKKQKATLGYSPLDRNLQRLPLTHMGPDVLILGEFLPSYLESDTLQVLEAAYPYRARFPYAKNTEGQEREIGVFSRVPFQSRYFSEALDFVPMGASVGEQEAYREEWSKGSMTREHEWVRSYQRIEFTTARGTVSLVPVHFSQPWALITATDGKWAAAFDMMLTGDHPIANQIERLFARLRSDLGEAWSRSPVVVLGDFNLPKQVYGIRPSALAPFRFPTHDVLASRSEFSFPAISDPDSKSVPQLRIDQAWGTASSLVTDAEVLQIRGSDHYPIWMSLEK